MDADEWVDVTAAVYRRLTDEHGFDDDTATELTRQVLEEVGKDARTDAIQRREFPGAMPDEEEPRSPPEPATDKQKRYMDNLGVEYDDDISKREASERIDQATQDQ